MFKRWLHWIGIIGLFLVSLPTYPQLPPGLVVSDVKGDQTTLDYMQWQAEPYPGIQWQTLVDSQHWQYLETATFGFQFNPVWTRLTLINPTPHPQRHVLYNPHAGMDKLDVTLVYQTQNETDHIEHYQLGLISPAKTQPIPHRYSTLLINLEPYQNVTLYTRLQTLGAYQVDWRIAEPRTFTKASHPETLFWGVFGGLILFLVIYNLLVMCKVRQPVLWPYIAFALMSLYYQYATKGILRFDPTGMTNYIVSLMTWVMPFLILASLTYFSMLLFNTKVHLPRLHRLLKVAIAVYLLAFAAHLSGLVQMFGYMTPGLIIAYIGIIIPVIVGIIAWRYKLVGAQYYLAGQSALMVGHLTLIGVLNGTIPNNTFTSFAIPIGILLDLFFLSLAFSHRVAKLSKDYDRQRQLMIAQSRFSSMGQAFGSISYEWRVPLVRLGAQLTELETRLIQQPWQGAQASMESLLNKMQMSLHGLVDTVHKFRHFYSVDNKVRPFEARERLHEVLKLLKGKQAWSMTEFNVYAPEPIEMRGYPNSFSQVLMLLLDQTINLQQDQTQVLVRLEKIDHHLVLRLRNIHWTETQDEQSLDLLNLTTAQILVEDKLDGRMVYHWDNDAMEIDMTLPIILQERRST